MQIPGRRQQPQLRLGRPSKVRAEKNALTAAGFRISQRDADTMRRLIQPWQQRAFTYYDSLGEIKYAAQFYSRAMSSLRLYIGEVDENDDIVETKNEDVKAYLTRIQDPGGGRSGLLSAYGRLIFLVGEAQLFVSMNRETEMEQWEMLSTDELRTTGSGYSRYKAPSLMAEDFKPTSDDGEDAYEPIDDDTAVAYRLWKRHPRYSMLADSTMQGVLDLCEELMLLTQAVRARARSRLAGAGLLLIPEEVSPKPPEPVGDEDPLEDIFLEDFTEAMTSPITDEGSAEAVVPLIVRGQAEHLDKIRHIQIVDPTQLYPETGLRRECIERIAIGLDMPPEVLLGISDANHWTAWMIDEQTWKGHLQPLAKQLVDDLTAAYLRPSMKADGVEDWEKYSIAYDATDIINHPDRAKDAKDLWDREAISDEALRTAAGFEESDAPDEEEWRRRVGVKIRDGSMATYGIPSLKPGGIEPAEGDIVTADSGSSSAEVVKGPPQEQPAPPSAAPLPETVLGSLNGHNASRVLGASDLALLRAREAAGNRVRNLSKRDPDMAKAVEGVRAGRVCVVLGQQRVRALGIQSELELVRTAHDIILDAFRVYDLDDEITARLVDLIEQHAALTLYAEQPLPLPTTYTNYVQGAVK